jgi:hypothetical protein
VDHRRRQCEREERLHERGKERVDGGGPLERLVERRGLAEHRRQEALCLRNQLVRRRVGPERLEVPSGLHECVVRDPRHRGVPAAAVDTYGERSRRLLRGRAQVHRRRAEQQPIAAALVDRVVAPNRVGMLGAEPDETEAVLAADLLVRGRDEDEVA